ncbi:MAG: ABC transporter ATP-binding protein [Nitrososphaerota archaeon]|nr:ABC transporter ATP-binding protein [Candidatus Calditenuis fumarioli]
MLELIDVWKVYRTGSVEYPALRGVTLRIEDGEFVAVVGPSGSGKTTLLNLVGALDLPTKGDIVLNGTSYTSLGRSGLNELRRKELGFVFQTFNLLSHLTALENVELPLIAAGVPRSERRRRALEMLARLGMENKASKKPTELSGGEQQRVAIARALVNNPSVILADEPTGNLDSANAKNVVELLREINKREGKTILLVTHNLEIAEYADRIVRMRDGRVESEVRRN